MYPRILCEPLADELETAEHILGTADLDGYVISTVK